MPVLCKYKLAYALLFLKRSSIQNDLSAATQPQRGHSKAQCIGASPGARCPLSTASLSITSRTRQSRLKTKTRSDRYISPAQLSWPGGPYFERFRVVAVGKKVCCYINAGTATRPLPRCACTSCIRLVSCCRLSPEASCPSTGANLLTRDLRRRCCPRCLSPRPTARTGVRAVPCLLRGCS